MPKEYLRQSDGIQFQRRGNAAYAICNRNLNKTNNDEIRAASGGTLQVESQVAQDPNTGLILAEDGGIVKLMSSGRVIEGRLQSLGSGWASNAAVPEPASRVLFLIGMLMMFSRRSAAAP